MTNALAFLARDLAVDLGTASTLIYARGRGIVLDEPSVIAVNSATGRVVAVGDDAGQMIGRTPPSILAVRPLKAGVIADFELTERMLRYFLNHVHARHLVARPRMIVTVPGNLTDAEQSAVKEAAHRAGAGPVYVLKEPLAAAIGAGLPVNEPVGNMIVDIGGGTTEVAVISLGGVVVGHSIGIGGDDFDQAIMTFVEKEYSLELGERTAESIKILMGSAFPARDEPQAEIRGRDLVSGMPRTAVISADEVRQALHEPLSVITGSVMATLGMCPVELAWDVIDHGIALAGGGAMLRGMDDLLRQETGLPVYLADEPLTSAALGTGKCVEDFDAFTRLVPSDARG